MTQSGVSPNFVMPVPLYVDFGENQYVRLGRLVVQGTTEVPFQNTLNIEGTPKGLVINANEDILWNQNTK